MGNTQGNEHGNSQLVKNSELEVYARDYRRLQNQCEEQSSIIAELRRIHRSDVTNLANVGGQNQRLKDELQNLEIIKKRIQADRNSFRDSVATITKQKTELLDANNRLNKEKENLSAELRKEKELGCAHVNLNKTQQIKLNQLENDLGVANNTLQQRENTIKSQAGSQSSLHKKYNELLQQFKKLEAELICSREQYTALRNAHEELAGTHEVLNEQHKICVKKNSVLERQLEEIATENEQRNRQLKSDFDKLKTEYEIVIKPPSEDRVDVEVVGSVYRLYKDKTEQLKEALNLIEALSEKEQKPEGEHFECNICMEERHMSLRVIFNPCGHGSCGECADQLSQCHMCRETIQTTIKQF